MKEFLNNLTSKKNKKRFMKIGSILLVLIALIPWIRLFFVAISGIDGAWDSMAYHLPYAAWLGGVYSKTDLIIPPGLEHRFDGFPVFGDFLQGVVWRVTGRVVFANLVSLGSLFLVAFAAYKYLKIHFFLSTLYLFSIPVVLIHSTSTYTDLIANAFVTINVIILLSAFFNKKFTTINLIFAMLALAVASNSKYQLFAVAVILWFLTVLLYLVINRNRFLPIKKNILSIVALGAILLFSGVLLNGTYLKNVYKYDNPFYPMEFSIAGIEFSGIEKVPTHVDTRMTENFGREVTNYELYLASISEIYVYNNGSNTNLFSIDQGGKTLRESRAFKAGGFFVLNLILWSLFIGYVGTTRKDKKVIFLTALFFVTVVGVGFLPSARLMRYWQFIPMSLAMIALAVQNIYYKDEKSLVNFVRVLQVALFLIVLRFTFIHYEIRDRSYLEEAFKVRSDQTSLCVVEKSFGVNYLIYNRDKDLQVVPNENKCIKPLYQPVSE